MIMNITLIIASLVALNFILLVCSCNRTPKKEIAKIKPVKQQMPTPVTNQLDTHQLAATGS